MRYCGRLKEKGEIDFSQAEFVALDEWLDLEDERENCTNFLKKHLYGPLGIQPEKMHLFDIHAANFKEECSRIDQIIFSHGGIDLMLLGLGMNGHLGLNEPGGSFEDYAKSGRAFRDNHECRAEILFFPNEADQRNHPWCTPHV